MAELVAYAKANPGKVSWGSQGFGVAPHLLLELFKLESKANFTHVPYRGTAPMLIAAVAGEVQVVADPMTTILPHIQSGKLRAIAIAGPTRTDRLPGVPTTGEQGYPKINSPFWLGVVAPAGTPADIVTKLNAAFREALNDPATQAAAGQRRRRDQDRHAGRLRKNARPRAEAVDRRGEGRQDHGGVSAQAKGRT